MRKPKVENKYNLKPSDINKLIVNDRSKIKEPLFWRNDVINAWCISKSIGTDAVVQKEIKQTKETLEMTPADRTDIIQQCNNRLAVLQQFAPQMMNEAEIEKVISDVLNDLELDNPTKREKGKIMKVLMPQVKGKADGKLVNQILERKLA